MNEDDEQNNSTENYAMWNTLISALKKEIHSKNSHLETILKMIETNLTYDDPGLFTLKNPDSEDERQRLEIYNTWLFNQLMFVLVDEKFTRSRPYNLRLQKEMLSASIMKQPWFFYKVIKKFLNILNLLNQQKLPFDSATTTSFDINLFHTNDSNFTNVCEFSRIQINNESHYNLLYDHCLEILVHAIALYTNQNKTLEMESNQVMLQCFFRASLNSKILIINYFILFFKENLKISSNKNSRHIDLYSNELLKGIYICIEKIFLLDDQEQIRVSDKFYTTTITFINKLLKLNLNMEIKFKHLMYIVDIVILLVKYNRTEISLYENLINLIKTNLISNKKLFISQTFHNKIVDHLVVYLDVYPELIELFQYSMIYDFKNSNCKTFKILLENLKNSKNNNNLYLVKLKLILNNAIVLNNYIDANKLQRSNLFDLNISPPNSNDFSNLIESLLTNTKEFIETKFISGINLIMHIVTNLFNLSELQHLPSVQQIKLLNIVFIPYLSSIQNNKNINKNLFIDDSTLMLTTLKSINFLLNNDQFLTKESSKFFYDIVNDLFINLINNSANSSFAINNIITVLLIQNRSFKNLEKLFKSETINLLIGDSNVLKNICCLLNGNVKIKKTLNNSDLFLYNYKIYCKLCDRNEYDNIGSEQFDVEKLDEHPCKNLFLNIYFNNIYKLLITTDDYTTKVNIITFLPSLFNHTPNYCYDSDIWINLFNDDRMEVRIIFSRYIHLIMNSIKSTETNPTLKQDIIKKCLRALLTASNACLKQSNKSLQICVVNSILKFALCSDLAEEDILFCFRMTILFMINIDSLCSREASMTASEICANYNVTPMYLLHTYKKNILKLIISLAVHTYINTDILCVCSLNTVTKMFGYAGTRDFTGKNYKLMLAMLLPFRIKYPTVEELMKEVSKCVQKDLPDALGSAFLTIYPYLYINEPAEITNECLDYVIQNTERTLYTLLHSDIKKTVAEILVHYHKSPECVLRAFRSILSKNEIYLGTDTKMYKEMSEFIAARFLGVLAFFESTILDVETEREMKKETLLSLGEMIRFLGSHHITAFRFKIIAMLKTAVSIKVPGFPKICVKVWTIFIHTVDLQTLGPLLSTIFVSLEPLLEIEQEGINAIAKYLIISNGCLLSAFIPDLFFIEDTRFGPEIKSMVKKIDESDFMSTLNSLTDQIVHENLGVRIYGLKYLKKLIATNRQEFNHLIIGQNTMDPKIEKLLECLMLGCKHADENLQLAAGECLGELGAIDPSLLPPNYAPQYKFALSVHTDSFAMVALDELCRAYQFQNDTKYVDNFSLAIQEILIERQVCPKTRKKIDVWEAIPERMRPLMEPLLTSCYTDYQHITSTKIHPIFGSSKCQSHEEWAIVWITKMIEYIQDENTKALLTSFRPSIKRSMNILSTFLPYILLHSLQTSTEENQQKIFEELACVFNFVLKSNESTNNVYHNQDRYRGIRSILFNDKNTTLLNNQYNDEHNDIGIKCAKLAFNQLEFLAQWCRQYTKTYSQEFDNGAYLIVHNFLKRFDKKLLAKVNFKCNEYARALLYIENFIEENPKDRLQEELSFLAEIYAELMNPDSLEGAMNLKRVKPTLNEQILSNNLTGRLQESAICFERLLQVSELGPTDMTDMIQCYLGLDQPKTALLMAEGFLKNIYDKNQHLIIQESCAEPLWRLSRFDELDELLTVPEINSSPNWGVKCGQLLLNIRKNNFDDFHDTIQTTKLNILKMLRIACIEQNSYQKGYPDVMKLHLINEFETVQEVIDTFKKSPVLEKTIKDLLSNWSMRKELLQPRPKMIEPLFCLRRILLNELKNWIVHNCQNQQLKTNLVDSLDESIGQFWIKSAQLARKSGMLQQAQLYIMNAEQYQNKELFIEKAKLYWKKGEQSNTFKILERGIQEVEDLGDMKSHKSLQRICAEGKLLIALYNAESMNTETFTTLKYFKDAVRCAQDYEKCLVQLANYLDRIYSALSDDDQQKERGVEMLQDIMFYYGKSLMFGCHYIYQSMPKMLTIWLNYTANTRSDEVYRRGCEKMNSTAERFSAFLPPFVFFTAFSQLVSRICHPSIDVYNVIKTILVKLITNFPQQSLWMISSVFKSSYPNRVKRCSEVFQDKRLAQPGIQKLITDFNSLVEKLIDLTNKTIPANEKHPCVSSLVPSLPKLLAGPTFSDIILPIQKHMLPTMPSIGDRDKPAESFNVFPNQMRYIKGIKEEMTILMSLQKPRKVTLIGDDGQGYIVMMKPKDDLRKDFRLMEFNAVVKEYLHQDPDARERRLNIRTYAVIPLNEECGIIEWLSDLQAFRAIVITIYKQIKKAMNNREVLAAKCAVRDPIAKKRDVFLNTLLPKHPPVFSEWFINRFTTPHNWYHARSSYIKTTAVMSIVGYILGLGDRHGENILFDATNGDTVHVDFNCLFNRGETFDYPEKVPFRLTHNMVHAMGPLGVEGLYRKCCEITLKILRTQKSTLMSVLKPFVYDPLVSWSRMSKNDRLMERTDSEAMGNVNNIEQRLKGLVKLNGKTQNIPLSVEGQVNSIILEATSIDNLASMYIGWGAYL